ncbi:hypothetical protein INT45_007929 [Circinella minor]|uniref:Uncharacterized protein n=1 Tax=Circinella minor TaxID=1195481 RepID=A0A8H7S6U2_9FUNG|nr:hypothetical protein INT45_007929 [Circinella minor]
MNDTLQRHLYRTTNAVESFYRDLYRNMVHRLLLSLALPQLLNYIQSDVRILANYEEHAVPSARILTASSHDSIDIADERTVHLLDIKVEPFDIEELGRMTKEVETGTEEIMQRIMCTDLKEVDQKECKEEKNNDEVPENTLDMMTKKNGRKNKKRKQHYNAEDLWPGSKRSNRRETSFVHRDIPLDYSIGLKQFKADGYCGLRIIAPRRSTYIGKVLLKKKNNSWK